MTPKKPRRTPQGGVSITISGSDVKGDVAGGDIVKDNIYQYGDVKVGAGGQAVVGSKNVRQTLTVSGLNPAELGQVKRKLTALEKKLDALELPAETKAEAKQKVAELKQELTATDRKPQGSKIVSAGKWLLQKIPALAGTLASVLISPVVGKVVGAAGELAADWVKDHFGKPAPEGEK
jgi:hypothetical protein